MDKNIRIKIWGLFKVNKKQFLIFYVIIAIITIVFAVFSYYNPIDLESKTSWFGKFYANNTVAFWLFLNLFIIIEGMYYWNSFYREQIKIISTQKEEILSQKEEIEMQRNKESSFRKKLESQNKQIINSIKYAQRIQKAVLPNTKELDDNFDNFIFFKPRDIVSGDFYWFKTIEVKNQKLNIIVAADCTGHGIPGAFVSMLGISLLNEITSVDNIFKSDLILNQLRTHIKKSLHQHGAELEQQDGMDMAIVIINEKEKKVEYAGANNSLYISTTNSSKFDISNKKIKVLDGKTNRKLISIKPDKMPVGIYSFERNFSSYSFNYASEDVLYLFSDGYIDQFGGEKKQKFMSKRFKELILNISDKEMKEQKNLLISNLENWQKNEKQLDDIIVMGIKLN
ncbi:MAG: SpoIIE family protein phosphatase [Bacteroidota bacterium]|nr:SpoIIE family protein phosphatase [Bacteroidota bacterium]